MNCENQALYHMLVMMTPSPRAPPEVQVNNHCIAMHFVQLLTAQGELFHFHCYYFHY